MKPRIVPVLVLALALAPAACTSTSSSSGTSATPTSASASPVSSASATAALCADATALRASVDKLQNVTVQTGVADELKADAQDVDAKLATLATDARGQWQSEVNALKGALSVLEMAIGQLAASPGQTTVSSVVSARAQVGLTARNLLSAVSVQCPGTSPSASG